MVMLKLIASVVAPAGANVPPLIEGDVLSTIGSELPTLIAWLGEVTDGSASCFTVTLTLSEPE